MGNGVFVHLEGDLAHAEETGLEVHFNVHGRLDEFCCYHHSRGYLLIVLLLRVAVWMVVEESGKEMVCPSQIDTWISVRDTREHVSRGALVERVHWRAAEFVHSLERVADFRRPRLGVPLP